VSNKIKNKINKNKINRLISQIGTKRARFLKNNKTKNQLQLHLEDLVVLLLQKCNKNKINLMIAIGMMMGIKKLNKNEGEITDEML
jgi:hypothetical protein